MASKSLADFTLTAFVCFTLFGCGGNSNSSSTGGGGSASTSEMLYASAPVSLLAFRVDPSSAKLTLSQTGPPDGSVSQTLDNPPIVVSMAASKYLYTINPNANGIDAYSMTSDGTLTPVAGSPFLVPQNVISNPELSSLMNVPSGKFLFALDASGGILQAQTDPSTGSVTYTSLSPSFGFLVRSAAIDPTGKSIYISVGSAGFTQTGDYAGIAALSLDPTTGQVSSAAGSPSQLASNSQPCQVTVTPSGRFVYASLNNADAIAAYVRDSTTSSLSPVAGSPFPTPRASSQTCYLAVHPSGKFLYALNLNGHDITGYAIDSTSGALTPLPGSPFASQTTPDVFKDPFTQGPMAIDPSGQFLFVLTTETYIAVYGIDQNSGVLKVSGSPRPVPQTLSSLNIFNVK